MLSTKYGTETATGIDHDTAQIVVADFSVWSGVLSNSVDANRKVYLILWSLLVLERDCEVKQTDKTQLSICTEYQKLLTIGKGNLDGPLAKQSLASFFPPGSSTTGTTTTNKKQQQQPTTNQHNNNHDNIQLQQALQQKHKPTKEISKKQKTKEHYTHTQQPFNMMTSFTRTTTCIWWLLCFCPLFLCDTGARQLRNRDNNIQIKA
jgi:hypothetical protein